MIMRPSLREASPGVLVTLSVVVIFVICVHSVVLVAVLVVNNIVGLVLFLVLLEEENQ